MGPAVHILREHCGEQYHSRSTVVILFTDIDCRMSFECRSCESLIETIGKNQMSTTVMKSKCFMFVLVMKKFNRNVDVFDCRCEVSFLNNIKGALIVSENRYWRIFKKTKISKKVSKCYDQHLKKRPNFRIRCGCCYRDLFAATPRYNCSIEESGINRNAFPVC